MTHIYLLYDFCCNLNIISPAYGHMVRGGGGGPVMTDEVIFVILKDLIKF